jgi:6-phospho-beta-glucosidase
MFAPDVSAVGVCNVAITTKMDMLEQIAAKTGLNISPENAHLDTLGLNHLSWHRGLWADGVNYWQPILQDYLDELRASSDPEYPTELIETLGMIPNYYLQYFYRTDHKFEEQKKWPPSRAEEVMEVERDLLRQYADTTVFEPPADLMKRGGAYYSTVATQLLNAHYNDLGEVHVVNARNEGAVKDWPEDWVLELPCKVNRSSIQPLPAEPLPEICFGLLAHVKSFELLTARAAVTGDRSILYQALLSHPLGPEADKITAVMQDLLTTHRQYLPLFWES